MKKVTYTQNDLDRLLAIKDKEIEMLRQFNERLMTLLQQRPIYYSYPYISNTNNQLGTTFNPYKYDAQYLSNGIVGAGIGTALPNLTTEGTLHSQDSIGSTV